MDKKSGHTTSASHQKVNLSAREVEVNGVMVQVDLPPLPPLEAYDDAPMRLKGADYGDRWDAVDEAWDEDLKSMEALVSRSDTSESAEKKAFESVRSENFAENDFFTSLAAKFGDASPKPAGNMIKPAHPMIAPEKPKRYNLNTQQKEAFDDLIAGLNIFLTGEGGTGKSYVIEAFIEWCIENGKKIVIAAPTGVAAINVGGVTLHRAFCMSIDYVESSALSGTREEVREVIAAADIILIDEIGMVRSDIFSHVEYKCRKHANHGKPDITCEESWGDKQIIVVGDFFQLAPVAKDKLIKNAREFRQSLYDNYGGVFAFETQAWADARFKNHILIKSERHKNGDNATEYMGALNKCRVGDKSALCFLNDNCVKALTGEETTVITFTNAKADDINRKRLASLGGGSMVINDIPKGVVNDGDRIAPQVLELNVGARVTMLVNDNSSGFVNGTMGVVEAIQLAAFTDDEDVIVVRDIETNATYHVKRHEWDIHEMQVEKGTPIKKKIGSVKQFPMRLAWAITAHKAQGKTLEKAILMLDGKYRSHGQTYVALSRVKSLAGLTLFKPIADLDIVCDPIVTQFYAGIQGFKMSIEYDPRMHKLMQGLKELEALAPPDGCLDWIYESIDYSLKEMTARRLKG